MSAMSILRAMRLLLCLLAVNSQPLAAQTISNLWKLAPGSRPYIDNQLGQRGLAANPVTGNVILVSRTTATNGIFVLDGNTGAELASLNQTLGGTNVFGNIGAFIINAGGVTDDGVIYVANLSTSTTTPNFRLYRWPNENPSSPPVIAFSGDPANGFGAVRWGDVIDVRGSGTNTQILVSSSSPVVALFTTTNGIHFTAKVLSVTNATGNLFQRGLAFGTGNSFWGKEVNSPLRHFRFDPVNKTVEVDGSFSSFPSNITPLELDASGQYLAGIEFTSGNLPLALRIYDASTFPSAPVFLMQTNVFASTNANSNRSGALGFVGTNRLFTLCTYNGITADAITFPDTPIAPSITTHPSSQTWYAGGNLSFSVVVRGSPPFTYQWQLNGTNVPSATSDVYILSNVQTNQAGTYRVVISNASGSVTSGNALLTVLQPFNTSRLTNIWNLVPGQRPYLTTTNDQRGLAFNPVSGNLLLATRTPSPAIVVLDPATGEEKHFMNVDPSVINGGFYTLNLIGAADDGAIYGANLVTAGSGASFRLYRWDSDAPDVVPLVIFSDDPAIDIAPGLRWGDTLAIRGAGTDTQILIGAGTGTNVALFTTADGVIFNPAILSISNAVSAFAHLGLAFGASNTFWAKESGFPLRLCEFNPTNGTGFVRKTFSSTNVPNAVTAIGVEPNRQLLAALTLENPDNVRLYSIADEANGPRLLDQEMFTVDNANGNQVGCAVFGGDRLFALDCNNGIKAFALASPAALTAGILRQSSTVTLNWRTEIGRGYQVQFKNSLSDSAWQNLGSITTATSTNLSFTNQISGDARFYRVEARD